MPIAYTEQERVTASSAPNRSFDRTTNNNDENTTTVDDASRRRRPPAPRPGGRWSKLDGDSEGGRDGGRYGGGGYRDRGSRGGRTPRRNVRGYHGDMRRDARLERELFDDLNNDDERPKTTGVNFDTYDDIPVEVSGRDVPPSIDAYTPDTVGMDLTRNARLCGYVRPTPIQRHSIPIGTAGRDMLACAQTGSGKTAGFLFPIISSMISKSKSFSPRNSRSHSRSMVYPEALVLAPTRELAHQIDKEARKFTYGTGIATAVVYGGYEVRVEQLRRLFERGGCDLLVATPGRLLDLIGRERISLENVRYLVLDEADQMLDMGFEPQIRSIVEFSDMPSGENRQTMMFSATFPESIQRLASDFLRDYVFVTVGRVGSASRDVTQTVRYVDERDKVNALMGYLLTIKGDGLILVFVETKRTCDYVEDVLRDRGFPACSVHGDKTQAEREEALASFKDGGTPVMVATDVASRGLDVPNVTHVINVDFPRNIDSYVHRIGRTGRAGNTGDAVSFVNDGNDVGVMKELCHRLREINQDVPEWLDLMCVRRRDEQPRRSRPTRAKKLEYRDYRTAFTGETTRSGTTSPSFVKEVAFGTVVGEGGDARARARVDETKKKNIRTKTEKTPSPMPISPDDIDLALPGEDETAAAARIIRRRRDAEERAAAETARAEEEAKVREAAERKRADDAARASEVEEEMLEAFSSGGMRGDTLARWSVDQGVLLPSIDKLVAHVLLKDSRPDSECRWAERSQFGAALSAVIGDDISVQMEVLWGIQRYCHELRYPRVEGGEYLVQAMFRGAYKYDLVDADGFASWKEDESHEHESGKTDAIVQTVDWFAWLEEDDDEEEEDENSDEEKEEDNYDGDNNQSDNKDDDGSAKENRGASDGGHTWFEMCE